MTARCAGCSGLLPEASRFCPHCGLAAAADETRVMAEQPTRPRRRGAGAATRPAARGAWPSSWRRPPRALVVAGVVLALACLVAAAWWLGRRSADGSEAPLSPSGGTRAPGRP